MCLLRVPLRSFLRKYRGSSPSIISLACLNSPIFFQNCDLFNSAACLMFLLKNKSPKPNRWSGCSFPRKLFNYGSWLDLVTGELTSYSAFFLLRRLLQYQWRHWGLVTGQWWHCSVTIGDVGNLESSLGIEQIGAFYLLHSVIEAASLRCWFCEFSLFGASVVNGQDGWQVWRDAFVFLTRKIRRRVQCPVRNTVSNLRLFLRRFLQILNLPWLKFPKRLRCTPYHRWEKNKD